jgi:hypothetical protein
MEELLEDLGLWARVKYRSPSTERLLDELGVWI